MERGHVIMLLKVIADSYSTFEVNEPSKIDTWHMILSDISFEEAKTNLLNYCRTTRKFPPVPADLISSPEEKTIYQIQKAEREQAALELKEYHDNKKVGPMPAHVAEQLKKVLGSRKVNNNVD